MNEYIFGKSLNKIIHGVIIIRSNGWTGRMFCKRTLNT